MAKITNEAEFKAWLKDKPKPYAQVLAARIAMRMFPIVKNAKHRKKLIPAILRCLYITWVARITPTKVMSNDVVRAAHAAREIYTGATSSYIAVYVAVIIASDAAVADNAAAADFAIYAATTISTDIAKAYVDAVTVTVTFWKSIESEATWLEKQALVQDDQNAKVLALSPLWPKGDISNGDILNDWHDFKAKLLKDNPSWQVWTDWYDRRLSGEPTGFGLEPKVDEDFCIELATKDNEFWQQEPNVVNEWIKSRLDELRVKSPSLDEIAAQIPEQDPSAIVFEVSPDGIIGLARVTDDQRLTDTLSARSQYGEFLKSLNALNSQSSNSLGAGLSPLVSDLNDCALDDILLVDANLFWPRANRLRRALRKHDIASKSIEFSPDRLDESVAEDLKDVVDNFNILVIGQPLLVSKETQSRGPVDPDVEKQAFAGIRDYIHVASKDREITTEAAGKVLKDIEQDLNAPETDTVTQLGKVEAKKGASNFILLCGQIIGAGSLAQVGATITDLIISNKNGILAFVNQFMPQVAEAFQKLLELFVLTGFL